MVRPVGLAISAMVVRSVVPAQLGPRAARDGRDRHQRHDGQCSEDITLERARETLERQSTWEGDIVTADYSGRRRAVMSADELFEGSAPVRSAADLAEDGLFDSGELEEFLADLAAMRRADLA